MSFDYDSGRVLFKVPNPGQRYLIWESGEDVPKSHWVCEDKMPTLRGLRDRLDFSWELVSCRRGHSRLGGGCFGRALGPAQSILMRCCLRESGLFSLSGLSGLLFGMQLLHMRIDEPARHDC